LNNREDISFLDFIYKLTFVLIFISHKAYSAIGFIKVVVAAVIAYNLKMELTITRIYAWKILLQSFHLNRKER